MPELDDLKVPLADLRIHIIELMKEGVTELSVSDFLILLRNIYRKEKDDG